MDLNWGSVNIAMENIEKLMNIEKGKKLEL